MKIAFISPMNMPVPDQKGAAVEMLMTHIINENEKRQELNIDLYTLGNPHKKYKCTNVINIKRPNALTNFFWLVLGKLSRILFNRDTGRLQDAKMIKALSKNISNHRYDIIIVENSMRITELILDKNWEIPVVYHIHNDIELTGDKTLKRWHRVTSRLARKIAISKFIAKRFSDTNGNDFDILYNAIDVNKFHPNKAVSSRQKYGISKKDVVIGFSGQISAAKGVKELIDAFRLAFAGNPKVKLLIAGDEQYGQGRQSDYMKSVINSVKPIRDQVIFAGLIHPSSMPNFYKSIDIAVNPTQIEEALSVAVIEEKAMGLPVIITRSGGMTELIKDGVSGFVIDRGGDMVEKLAESLVTLASSKKLRTRIGLKNSDDVRGNEMFSLNGYYNNFISILHKTVKHG